MPSRAVFLDSNGWLALLNESDSLHAIANETWRALGRARRPFVLTDLIVVETGNGLARTVARQSLRPAVERVRASRNAQVIPVAGQLLDRALELYDQRPDKTWGLVDCASFVVMRDHELVDAFTNDRHFEQAGFRCLLPLP
jgi:uncharacterized protein